MKNNLYTTNKRKLAGILLLMPFLLFPETIFCQNDFSAQLVVGYVVDAQRVLAADIDGDADIDIVGGGNPELKWFENVDGFGNTWDEHLIADDAQLVHGLSLADMDNDGDTDVLFASVYDQRLAWFENTDGLGDFGIQHIIDYGKRFNYVILTDLNGDELKDMVSSTLDYDSGNLSWYENMGNGTFSSPYIIVDTLKSPRSIVSFDVDNDLDNDLIITELVTDQIILYKNIDGSGTFGGKEIICNDISNPRQIENADMDKDGDYDIVLSSINNSIVWLENTDGNGDFGEKHILSSSINVSRIHCDDIDNDGDKDILLTAPYQDRLGFNENYGDGTFSEEMLITPISLVDNPTDVFAADINNDGKLDVISSSVNDDKIALYINEIATDNTYPNFTNQIEVFPNPANDKVFILGDKIEKITLYDVLGKMIFTKNVGHTDQSHLDINNYQNGVYILRVKLNNNIVERRIIKR